MPTPCRPPETAYESESNLPPACRMVMTTSTVGRFSFGCISTGMPRPLSYTVTPPSARSVTMMWSAWPAIASSTELSTTSWTRWCNPRSPVEPMYMLGRLRTASRPSNTVMEDAPYSFFFVVTGLLVAPALAHGPTLGREPPTRGPHRAAGRGGIPDGSLHREVPTAPDGASASRAGSKLRSDPAAETSGPFAEETLMSLPVERRGGGQARCLWMPWCHDPTNPIVTGAAGHPPMVNGVRGSDTEMILPDRGRRPLGRRCRGINRHRHRLPSDGRA